MKCSGRLRQTTGKKSDIRFTLTERKQVRYLRQPEPVQKR